ncbi:MAG: flavodoxin family protein [Bradymonadaceae bacterium]
MMLNDQQEELCDEYDGDFSDLDALFLNCTLKPSPKQSHTRGLIDVSAAIMEENGVDVEILRPVDYDVAPGVYPDMTEEGFEADDWPEIQQKVMDAEILVIGSPIWLGNMSSVATQVIERLYASSGDLNDEGQYAYYGRTAGCIVTGNEDGVKQVSTKVLYALQHIGYTITPQAGTQRSEWEAGCRFDHPKPEHR